MAKNSQHRDDSIRARLHNLERRVSRLEETAIEAIEVGAKVTEAAVARLEAMERLLGGVMEQSKKTVETIEAFQATTTVPKGST